jgi:D-alanyl-D-alanine dipeptidase
MWEVRIRAILACSILFLMSSCSNHNRPLEHEQKQTQISVDTNVIQVPKKIPEALPESLSTLRNIQTVNHNIFVELKYATSDNFMNQVLYDTLKNAYLQNEIAIRLGKCQDYLSKKNPNLHLLVYDAVRPLSVQQKMWDALDSIPVVQRVKFVSNPKNGSLHNYGAAVDLTICDEYRIPLDMGAGYDDMRLIAYPEKESYFLSTGELTKKQYQNRRLLREVMSSQRFRNIPTEWWHFNAESRETVKQKYLQIK